jgi:hypothetical protein
MISLRNSIALGAMLAATSLQLQAQTTAKPGFEVASVKLNPGCDRRPRSNQPVSPGRLTMECTTLNFAIQTAYGVWANGVSPDPVLVEVSGGPNWIHSEFYAIPATAGGDQTPAQVQGPMLQALLEDPVQVEASSRDQASTNLCGRAGEGRPQAAADTRRQLRSEFMWTSRAGFEGAQCHIRRPRRKYPRVRRGLSFSHLGSENGRSDGPQRPIRFPSRIHT